MQEFPCFFHHYIYRMISKKLIFSAVFLSIACLGLATADEDPTAVESDDSILSSFLSNNSSFSPFFAPAASKGEKNYLNFLQINRSL